MYSDVHTAIPTLGLFEMIYCYSFIEYFFRNFYLLVIIYCNIVNNQCLFLYRHQYIRPRMKQIKEKSKVHLINEVSH